MKPFDEIAREKLIDDLLMPIRSLCNDAAQTAIGDPSNADKLGQKIIASALEVLPAAERNGVPADIIAGVKDEVADAICFCVSVFGDRTSKWQTCLTMLETANSFANGSDTLKRVQNQLVIVQRNLLLNASLTPIDSPPSVFTFKGCGAKLIGNTERDPDSGSYMATYYWVIYGVPIFPVCRYRVIFIGKNCYRFLGKAPLRTMEKWHRAISIGVLLFIFFFPKK